MTSVIPSGSRKSSTGHHSVDDALRKLVAAEVKRDVERARRLASFARGIGRTAAT